MKGKKIYLVLVILDLLFLFACSSKENMHVDTEQISLYDYINNYYSTIDFTSTFDLGNLEEYSLYTDQYLKLVDGEKSFIKKDDTKKYFLNEYGELKGNYTPQSYLYYFFDIDSDGTPEIGVSDGIRFIYIFKYNLDSDEFILWHEVPTTWIRLMGSRKLWFYSGTSPIKYAFFELDENGDVDYSIWFYVEPSQYETKYMLTLPEYSNSIKNIKVPDEIALYSIEKDNHIYYQVTYEQWYELTKKIFEEKSKSKEKIKKITYTYNELFKNTV